MIMKNFNIIMLFVCFILILATVYFYSKGEVSIKLIGLVLVSLIISTFVFGRRLLIDLKNRD